MYLPQDPPPPATPQSQPNRAWPPINGEDRIPAPPTHGYGGAPPAASVPQHVVRAAGRWLRIPLDKPLVTPALLVVLFLIYLPMAVSPSINESVLQWGANMHLLVMQGEWYRLISATFLHASIGGVPFVHLLSNAYGLWIIGMELERLIGRAQLAAVYFISGLTGSVASFVFLPANVPSVGASGAIFGLIGAMAVYFALHRKMFGRMGNAWFWNMIVIIVLNTGIGFSGVLPVDNSAHLGGLVAGAVVGFVLSPRYALGNWFNVFVRNTTNINRGLLPWVATALLALIVIFAFLDLFQMYEAGILQTTYMMR